MKGLNELFGFSLHLLVFEMFLENVDSFMNLREISRKVDKNPGSISRILPMLVQNKLLKQIRVGKNMFIYCLNKENKVVKLIIEFYKKLKNSQSLRVEH